MHDSRASAWIATVAKCFLCHSIAFMRRLLPSAQRLLPRTLGARSPLRVSITSFTPNSSIFQALAKPRCNIQQTAFATMQSPPPLDGAVTLTNRCDESKSPYVRSHMDNPTAWQLWSPSTLELARKTNRLLFVSIGYSACHWCHVMAHESFDDPRIAQLLNEHFIPIKIDREERPDIDRQYMDFLQATSGGGGWPLNVFVTPDLEPIFGGTYWPGPKSERAKPGGTFEDILVKVAQAWKDQRERQADYGTASRLRTRRQSWWSHRYQRKRRRARRSRA